MSAKRFDCQTASEFLAQLDPLSALWKASRSNLWAFRGHANADWPLVPSALREGQPLSFRDRTVKGPLAGTNQKEAELQLLREFVFFADELAFRLPGDWSEFLFPWAEHEGVMVMNDSWPPYRLLELVAIAQHHGVPTRLLDFSFNPFVAAYFAACAPCDGAQSLAVWAVDIPFVYGAWPTFENGIRVVQVPRAANPFLHAQSGLFLYDAADTRIAFDQRVLDQNIEAATHINADEKAELSKSDRIRIVTLPGAERESLLKLLDERRITRAHLMPTLDNVVRELKGA